MVYLLLGVDCYGFVLVSLLSWGILFDGYGYVRLFVVLILCLV